MHPQNIHSNDPIWSIIGCLVIVSYVKKISQISFLKGKITVDSSLIRRPLMNSSNAMKELVISTTKT